jgi:aminopeptidase N
MMMQHNDPHSFSNTGQGRIQHIDFRMEVNFESRTINAQVVYSFENPIQGSLFLDTRQLDIKRIHMGGRSVDWEIDQHDPIKGSRLHIKDLEGASSCTIEYNTTPSASALQWLTPNQTSGGEHPYLYSQCQSIHARSIFPCQDTPSVRFTFTAEIEIPNPLTVVMGAALVGSRINEATSEFRFDMPQPIPSYLFAIAAGNIQFRSIGSRCGIYAEPELLETAAWEFAKTEDMLNTAERLFGPYVWDRYDILILPPAFPYGGMENPRLTFLNPMFIIGDRSETIIVTHELAHAWTGNLVTNATWEDFWLNEGWTTYAQSRITEELEGREYSQFRAALSRSFMFEDMQRFGMESQLTKLNFPMQGINPDEVFSTIPYHKGSAFISHLEETVGRERFDEFIKAYIEKYQFKSISTETFIDFLKEKIPDIEEQVNIQEWIFEPGFPQSAPTLQSDIYTNVVTAVEKFKSGELPREEDVSRWKPAEITLFLRLLPERVSIEECRFIEALFDFKTEQNPTTLTMFYIITLRNGYEDVWSGIQILVARIGRGFLLNRIFRAMAHSGWARDRARDLFEINRPRYHPLNLSNIESILKEAGI